MTSDPLTISVAILTWNRKEQVLRAIRSAFEQSYPPHEVVVVDSASTDGSAEAISREFPTVRIIRFIGTSAVPRADTSPWRTAWAM